MKKLFKNSIELLPGQWSLKFLNALRWLRYPKLRRQRRLDRAVLKKYGWPDHVLKGPFKGMRYISAAYFGSVVPKVLGVYEMELAESIGRMGQARPDVIVDIGAAEGYYAVGMALQNRQAKMICYEMYQPAQALLRELALLNSALERVEIRGICSADSLRTSLASAKRPAVICDCEGAEDFLMDPQAVPELASAVMIVEIHDEYVPDVSRRIQERFEKTHDLTVINRRARVASDLPDNVSLTEDEFAAAIDERRASALWYFLVPKNLSLQSSAS